MSFIAPNKLISSYTASYQNVICRQYQDGQIQTLSIAHSNPLHSPINQSVYAITALQILLTQIQLQPELCRRSLALVNRLIVK